MEERGATARVTAREVRQHAVAGVARVFPALKAEWPESQAPEEWEGVEWKTTGLCGSTFRSYPTPRPLLAVPAVIGQFTSLTVLDLGSTQLTSVPAEIWQLTSLEWLDLRWNQLTSLPAEIGQLTSLQWLYLNDNRLTSLPAEIGQLTSLRELRLIGNSLTGLPVEIGQLTSLEELYLSRNQLTSSAGGDRAAHVADVVGPLNNNLTSLPAEIGQLASLKRFYFSQQQADERPGLDNKRAESEGMQRVDLGLTRLFNSSQLVRPAT